MEGHGISWWEPIFEGMCYMHGLCFYMLTSMSYISVCRKIYGVICGKGFAHVPMVNSIAVDSVYRSYSACGRAYEATHKRHYQCFHFHGACWGKVRSRPYASMWGFKWGGCLQMFPSNGALNRMLIPWVSEVIYYCIYLEFGIISMFLTSFYALFCVLCALLVGSQ